MFTNKCYCTYSVICIKDGDNDADDCKFKNHTYEKVFDDA
jgi:hypothetical protein